MHPKRMNSSLAFFILLVVFLLLVLGQPAQLQAQVVTFTAGELLGKPTDTSVTVNIVPGATIEYYYEYGTAPGSYTGETAPVTATGGQPHEVVITGLSPNTRYYYRMIYDGDGDVDDGDYEVRAEHTFHTQRAKGEEFVFTITSDSHEQMNAAHQQAMQNVLLDQPDFHLDLGDTFYVDGTTLQSQVDADYLDYRDPLYMGAIGPSVPIFLTPGNHENEEGWNFDDMPFSIALASVQARKAYYPTPVNDGFYSGNTDTLGAIDEVTYGDEYREDYYAWEWGDALFVVIDEYQYTMDLPYTPTAGEGGDDSFTGDQWSWTLGETQYNWFKQTIENSNAKYKFVFSHHMTGGVPDLGVSGGPGYVRGGAGAAPYFEWGGKNADDSEGFATNRPGWEAPIHQLMIDNGVSAYFHGHDHQYVYEELDGVVYQEVPSPSMTGSGFGGIYSESDPYTIEMLPNSGHLRVTVNPTEATVDYVRSNITEVSYTYTIAPNEVTAPVPLYRVNAGGDTLDMVSDPDFAALHFSDLTTIPGLTVSNVSGENSTTNTIDLSNVDPSLPEALFQTVLYRAAGSSAMTFDFDVPNGNYNVLLHSAEHNFSSAGSRVFDIFVEGVEVLPDYDPFVAAGGQNIAVTENVPTTVSDGVLTLAITPQTSVAIIRGIEIVPAGDVTTYDLTVAVDPVASGITTPAVGVHTYAEGAVVDVTAIPASGYAFDSWSGACTGSGACQVTMDANKTVTANFTAIPTGPITLDGAVSSDTADDVSSIAFPHTTGTGTDRLTLVGVSWNSGTSATDISSVTFTYDTTELPLTQAGVEQYPSNNRYSAIYSLLNPPSGQAGTVTVTFSGSVGNGIVAGAANFAGVDQGTPLGTFVGASGTDSTNPSVDLTGLAGDELVFDNLFAGGASPPDLTVGTNQNELWNDGIANLSGGASTEQATGSSVTMSWTRSGTNLWAIGAVPINPATTGTTYDLTMAVDPAASGTTTPAVGVHTYAEGAVVDVTATPASGYAFDSWSGACTGSSVCQVTMDANKTVTANFVLVPTGPITLDGAVSSDTADGVSSIAFPHTTGTGASRLTLVGVSANSYNAEQTISSVVFSYDSTDLPLTEVGSIENEAGRLAAIYSLVGPPSGQAGTVTVTFSGNVQYGIVAGAANFAGVNQADPLDDFVSAVGTEASAVSVDVPTDPNDLVFDTVFMGAATIPSLAADASQTELWDGTIDRVGGAASTEQATTSTTPMSWTATGGATAYYWAIGAVPINPATTGTTYDLTMAVDPAASGTTSPAVGVHTYAEGAVVDVTATPASGYAFDSWSGACTGSSACQVTMDANKTVTANFVLVPTGPITLDGAVSSDTADGVSSIAFPHTTGTGTNRLTLVGVSANSYNAEQTISSVVFSYGSTTLPLTVVGSIENEAGRLAAIYSLVGPPSGQAGTVTVTFSGNVQYGIVAGAANFAGVYQADPFDDFVSAVGTEASAISVNVPTDPDDLVFDTIFMGAATIPSLTADASQTELWDATIDRAGGAASTEQATTSTTPMSWTASGGATAYYWAIGAVPINPAPTGTTYDLTMAVDPAASGTTTPAVGVHTYAEDAVVDVTATPASGYAFDSWSGACTGSGACQVTMDANKTVTANFAMLLPDHNILLGRPTDDSVTVNAILAMSGEVSFEYGTAPGSYTSGQTSALAATAGVPVEVVIDGLSQNTRYYYRLRYRATSSDPWIVGDEYSFHTQRADDETFAFTITSDSHLGQTFSGNTPARYEQTTLNVAADNPDFHLDLGDAFIMMDAENQTDANNVYLAQRPYFGNFSHSAPVFIAIGNHENEEGWNLDDTPFSQALGSIIARKQYFPNPVPDAFYTGNSDLLPAIGGDQLREDYYAWEWGDALYIVLDPFQYTMTKPYGPITGSGEADDEVVDEDQWNWTLGQQQFDWFKQTLENSNAKFKFVFSHHVVGGQLDVSGAAGAPGYVRGGGMAAPYFEWGGYNADDTWGFDTERSGWGDDPIHQLMVDNAVNAFFHGHDHQFVHEEVDGIAYQLVPSASMTGLGFDLYGDSPYAVEGGNLPNAGHLRVTVSECEATVEYVRSEEGGGGINGTVAYAYTIVLDPCGTLYQLTMAVDPSEGGSTTPAVGVHTYIEGTDVDITAIPAAGYAFDYWTGDVADPDSASTTVMIDADKTVTAHFIDNIPPNTTITAQPPDPSVSANASFSFTSTETGSTFECQLDSGGFSTCTTPKAYTGLADGAHTFEVRAIDGAGNTDPSPASYDWTIDTVAPDTTITGKPPDPSNNADPSFSFISDETGSTFECQLDSGGFSTCTSPKTYTGLAEGAHTFEVRAIDGAGNTDPSPASYSWTIDTVAPDTTITAQPPDPSNSADASFSFTSTETGSTFECQLDSGGFSTCTTPKAYTGLADGAHTFQVRAIDGAGNTDLTPASYSWTIDTVAPNTTITAYPPDPSDSADASFSFTSTAAGSTFECQLDGGGFSACTSPKAYTGLAAGAHTFEVRATDGVGNTDPTPASYSWTIYRVTFMPIIMN